MTNITKLSTRTTKYYDPSDYALSWYKSNETGLPTHTDMWIRTVLMNSVDSSVKYQLLLQQPNKFAVVNFNTTQITQMEGNWKPTPEEWTQITQFVINNKQALIQHIDGELCSGGLGEAMNINQPGTNNGNVNQPPLSSGELGTLISKI